MRNFGSLVGILRDGNTQLISRYYKGEWMTLELPVKQAIKYFMIHPRSVADRHTSRSVQKGMCNACVHIPARTPLCVRRRVPSRGRDALALPQSGGPNVLKSTCCVLVSGRGTTKAEGAQGTPTQSNLSPSILVYEDKTRQL